MARPEKELQVKDISEKIKKSKIMILTEYRGLNVAQMMKIKRKVRGSGGEYKVIKNTLTQRALKDHNLAEVLGKLEGPLAMAFGYDDAVATTKVLSDFAKEFEKLQIRSGLLGTDKILSLKEITALAKLPSRQVLLAQVVGQIKAPISGLVYTLKGTLNKLVYVLEAVKKSKEGKG